MITKLASLLSLCCSVLLIRAKAAVTEASISTDKVGTLLLSNTKYSNEAIQNPP